MYEYALPQEGHHKFMLQNLKDNRFVRKQQKPFSKKQGSTKHRSSAHEDIFVTCVDRNCSC